MEYVSPPVPNGKGEMGINKFRDLCRKHINASELTPAHKLVFCRLVDYVNSESLIAWPAFDTLASDCGIHRSTAIEALNAARKGGIVMRLYKGGKLNGRGKSNAYMFPMNKWHSTQSESTTMSSRDTVGIDDEHSRNYRSTQSELPTQSSNYNLIDNLIAASPSSSALEGHSAVVAKQEGVGEEEGRKQVFELLKPHSLTTKLLAHKAMKICSAAEVLGAVREAVEIDDALRAIIGAAA